MVIFKEDYRRLDVDIQGAQESDKYKGIQEEHYADHDHVEK